MYRVQVCKKIVTVVIFKTTCINNFVNFTEDENYHKKKRIGIKQTNEENVTQFDECSKQLWKFTTIAVKQ